MYTTMRERIGGEVKVIVDGYEETLIESGYSRGENGCARVERGNCTRQQETQKKKCKDVTK